MHYFKLRRVLYSICLYTVSIFSYNTQFACWFSPYVASRTFFIGSDQPHFYLHNYYFECKTLPFLLILFNAITRVIFISSILQFSKSIFVKKGVDTSDTKVSFPLITVDICMSMIVPFFCLIFLQVEPYIAFYYKHHPLFCRS